MSKIVARTHNMSTDQVIDPFSPHSLMSIGLAALLTLGNLSFPIAVMAGYLEPTNLTFHFPELM